jgi:hypothetical protein
LVGIEVTAVDGKKALHEFVELPFEIYRNDPNWVPQLRIAVKELLDREKHPFYANAEAEFFLAREGGRVVGRHHDRNHNRLHEENAGFSFFECRQWGGGARWGVRGNGPSNAALFCGP